MKKKLWVSRDKDGYCIWTKKPKMINTTYDGDIWGGYQDLDEIDLIQALYGCSVPLKLNQLKRIELTITAEVKEI
jgi:hypothetical protein